MIETRPIISGNIVKHPASKKIELKCANNLKNTNLIHRKGFMIGCNEFNNLIFNKFKKAMNELNNI